MIVDALVAYNQPLFVYIPPFAELRGGAWVVVDSTINADVMEFYAAEEARGGVLEAAGAASIKFRDRDIVAAAHRMDQTLMALDKGVSFHLALCCVVLCCVVLCCVVLRCVALRCVVLCCVALRCVVVLSSLLFSFPLLCAPLLCSHLLFSPRPPSNLFVLFSYSLYSLCNTQLWPRPLRTRPRLPPPSRKSHSAKSSCSGYTNRWPSTSPTFTTPLAA